MPVYEAISNALYAIQHKYPDNWADTGVIEVEVLRKVEKDNGNSSAINPVIGFVVSDNGVGLEDDLFDCFQELDTEYRADKNGRGIGRLSWLKVFKNVSLVSIFTRGSKKIQRSFTFQLSNKTPFKNYEEEIQKDLAKTGTIVHLNNYIDIYFTKSPIKQKDIQNKLISHFISIFAQPKRLRINLIDEGKVENLSDLFFRSIVGNKKIEEIYITEDKIGIIEHMLLPKNIAPIGNSIIYCAAERSVITTSIDEVIGMKHLSDNDHGSLIYIGLISGEVFDDALNHERTSFDFGDINFEEVNKIFVNKSKEYLEPYLSARRTANKMLFESVVSENPMYLSVVEDVDKYIEQMPLNWDETKLVQDVAVKRYRAKKRLTKQIEKLDENVNKFSDEEYLSETKKIIKNLSDTEKSSLAQYVVERRLVINLLKQRRKIAFDSGKHNYEESVHEVICPLGVTNDVIDYDDHNLWLIDDRLAYYSFVASDRPISSFSSDTSTPTEEELNHREELGEIKAYSDTGEPDLFIYKYPLLFRRKNTNDSVTIVEFKAPGKIKYSGAVGDNPIMQIRKYIITLRKRSCYDVDGNKIADITERTPFICFLIAESSPQLDNLLNASGITQSTIEGYGRYGFFKDLNAYFEFIPYDQVIRNAELRNEAFFKKLGLSI